MDTEGSKKTVPRELPPLPQQGQRALPTIQDTAGEAPAPKVKKKRVKKETNGVSNVDDHGMEMGGLGSRKGSEIGEQLTLEDAPPQRRKKKKKTATIGLEDNQADLVNGNEADHRNTDGEQMVKKPKKKKKSKVVESQLPDDLDIEEDDIIADTPPPMPQHSLFSAPQSESQPVGKVFVEGKKRFQAAERSDWRKTSDQMDNTSDLQNIPPHLTIQRVSVMVHKGFRMFGLYCNGFLAGFAVWNMVVVYMLARQHLTALSNLLEQYHTLAYPSQCLFYMLLAISTVAAFDRMNLAKGIVALRKFSSMDPTAIASFLYFSALVLSLSQQMTSDRINLYPTLNETFWPPGLEHHILHPWVNVNLVVALLVGLAWIIIAIWPEKDDTESYLDNMKIEPPKPDDKFEISA